MYRTLNAAASHAMAIQPLPLERVNRAGESTVRRVYQSTANLGNQLKAPGVGYIGPGTEYLCGVVVQRVELAQRFQVVDEQHQKQGSQSAGQADFIGEITAHFIKVCRPFVERVSYQWKHGAFGWVVAAAGHIL